MDLNTIFENRNAVNKEVVEAMQNAVQDWGATILRFALVAIEPADPTVSNSLHKQAAAEREQKETIINSEAKKEALMKQADANLYSIMRNADAYEYEQIQKGEGEKSRIIAMAEAEKESIDLVAKALEIEGGDYTQRMRLSER